MERNVKGCPLRGSIGGEKECDMKSEWKVMSIPVNGKKVYQVYRLYDRQKVMQSGNMETAKGYAIGKHGNFRMCFSNKRSRKTGGGAA